MTKIVKDDEGNELLLSEDDLVAIESGIIKSFSDSWLVDFCETWGEGEGTWPVDFDKVKKDLCKFAEDWDWIGDSITWDPDKIQITIEKKLEGGDDEMVYTIEFEYNPSIKEIWYAEMNLN